MRYGSYDIILPPAYLPPVAYYAAKAACRRAEVDYSMPFNKRAKDVHRTSIQDANGIISLTIPIEKPQSLSRALWSDIRISGHNHWWNIHLTALKSAYGRTPFFEYYLADFLPFYSPDTEGMALVDYLRRLDDMLTRLLGVDIVRRRRAEGVSVSDSLPVVDLRRVPLVSEDPVPYYQQRNAGAAFTDGLSAVDLLFNMGPESMLVLDRTR